MTDEQIVKALEYCSSSDLGQCKDCPFYEQCENDELLAKYTLDLIKRQKAEIEKLQNPTGAGGFKEVERKIKKRISVLGYC